ncbi:SIMPL domain-containing protein [Specibacter sp. NPDC057265]|uniref:SIMPL domain-containing protein n=1 Tax=Specibacter sp. NPDC057265 TaxID=3346075 RepID=UPI003630E1A3
MSQSTTTSSNGTVTVLGRGSVKTAPDSFTITVGIEASQPTVRGAYTQAGTAVGAVSGTLLSLGVAREAITSSSLDVRVDSRWQDGVGTVVTGYTVSSTLSVNLRHDQGADRIVAAVVEVGDNSVRLHEMTAVLSDSTASRDAARAAAWEDARHGAEHFAQLTGRVLGQVLVISEEHVQAPGPHPLMARAAMTVEAAPLPIEAGQGTVSAQLQATWELL